MTQVVFSKHHLSCRALDQWEEKEGAQQEEKGGTLFLLFVKEEVKRLEERGKRHGDPVGESGGGCKTG